jgi:DNA-binding SARP family transcriptional activator
MTALRVHLLGKFRATTADRDLAAVEGAKVQELFCYLLLHRNRPLPRETLAGLLWGDSTTARSRKYLRQALWQLQAALSEHLPVVAARLLRIDGDWVSLIPGDDLWLDVALFEAAFAATRSVPGRQVTAEAAEALRSAAAVYQGDLLEGWYQDWCIAERERMQAMYLLMLNKLMIVSEARGEFEAGLAYGDEILRIDPARENTHRQLMRLHYFAGGDRTAAFRQYERCVAALREEFGVQPSATTVALYDAMRRGELDERPPAIAPPAAGPEEAAALAEVFGQILHLRELVDDLQASVQRHFRPAVDARDRSQTQPNRPIPQGEFAVDRPSIS